MTPDHLPHIHELAPGLYAGWGARSRHRYRHPSWASCSRRGRPARAPREIDYPTQPMKALPLHGFNRFAVELVAQYYRLRDAWG